MNYEGFASIGEFIEVAVGQYVDICKSCGKPILYDEEIYIWKDGERWHIRCVDKLYEGY
jgi:hypothetical protein